MATVTLKNIMKIYPNTEKPRKKWFGRKTKTVGEKKSNLQITSEGVVAVQKFDLEIADHEFIVLVGPSGCGKSTTLRMVAGLEEISGGELLIDGRRMNEVAPAQRDIAMVFQNYALYPHMTVYENMAFSLKMQKLPKDEIDKKVREAAAILDITEYLERRPRALSGGQRQRVAIGRAIVRDPKVFLMDEPLSNLDAKLRNQMRAEIIKLREKIDTTFLYVTHDQTEAMTLGDRIVVMKDGCIQQIGTPSQVFNSPANLFVAGFIGTPQMNFFRGCRLSCEEGRRVVEVLGHKVELPPQRLSRLRVTGVEDKQVVVGVRPFHIHLAPEGIEARVEVCERMGAENHLHLSVGGSEIIAVVPGDEASGVEYAPHSLVHFTFAPEGMQLFDADTQENLLVPVAKTQPAPVHIPARPEEKSPYAPAQKAPAFT